MVLRNRLLLASGLLLLCHLLVQAFLDYRQIESKNLQDLQHQSEQLRKLFFHPEGGRAVTDGESASNPHRLVEASTALDDTASSQLQIRYVSLHPINPDNQPNLKELQSLNYFERKPDARERFVRFKQMGGDAYYHYSQPIETSSECLACHGLVQARNAGADQGYREGELQGLISIQESAVEIDQQIIRSWTESLLSHLLVFLFLFIAISYLMKRRLILPMASLQQAASAFSQEAYDGVPDLSATGDFKPIGESLLNLGQKLQQNDQALCRLKSLYSILSYTNKTIIRVEPPQEIYESFCQIAVNHGCFTAAWIGEVRPGDRSVRLLTSAHYEGEEAERSVIPFNRKSPLTRAIEACRPVYLNRIEEQNEGNDWHPFSNALRRDAVAILPICNNQKIESLLVVYAEKIDFFDDAVRDLLEEVVSDLAFAIDNYARNQAHQTSHQELESSTVRLAQVNRQMRLLLESTGEGIFGVDREGRCRFINQAGAAMLGYEQSDLLNQPIHEWVRMPEFFHHPFNAGMAEVKAPKKVKDESFRRQDGTLFPVEYSSYPILENGESEGAVTVFRDVTETRSMMREMRFLASHDPLTHLLNRHAFDQRLRDAFNEAKDFSTEHVLCYMDLDQFKLVNDTCGHVAGDTMLRQLSHHLRQATGADGVLARLGGDEFGLLLERCSLNDGLRVTERIFDTVKQFRFTWEGRTFSCGVSIGVAVLDPDMESPHNVLSAADTACYVAKDMGRNRLHIYRPYDEEISRQQGEMRWVNRIEMAIQQERFSLMQQKIISLDTEAMGNEHLEILLRMQDEQGGLILPGAFIPAAERYNLMPSLDRWVIRNTFSWLADNPTRLEELGACSINLSGQSLGDGNMHEFILEQLRQFSLPAEKVLFEITETAVVNRLDQAVRFMSLLKRRGFRFALDDFGTGVSSFAYLKNLPVDYLKIDGSFVKNMMNDPVDRAMVESINRIGHMVGLITVAEYVESDEIMQGLIEIGVDFAQGYGVARPKPLAMAGLGTGSVI